MPIFNFKDEEALGKVASVDTTNVIVEVENVDQLKRLQVNHLAVLQSSRPGQHLIGLITQVTRKRGTEDIINDGINDHVSELNLCRIALIGTMLDRDGERKTYSVVLSKAFLKSTRIVSRSKARISQASCARFPVYQPMGMP